MSVFDRASLEESPIADLHAIASELSIDGYRRLRKGELVDAIIARQSGEEASRGPGESDEEEPRRPAEPDEEEEPRRPAEPDEEEEPRRRRGRRGGRGRGGRAAKPVGEEAVDEDEEGPRAEGDEEGPRAEGDEEGPRAEGDAGRPSGARDEEGPRGEGPEEIEEQLGRAEDEIVAGVVELLPGGSGFVRVDPPEPSDDDVYISASQVKRCELVSGDRITGPRRPPRRSERFASLLRVDTINGQPAAEVAAGARFDDLPAEFPSETLALAGEGPLIADVVPIGRGSRVTIAGPSQSGKTELLRRLAETLGRREDLKAWLVLAGVRPEEIPQWQQGAIQPAATATLTASAEAQGQAVEGVIEQARRIAARGTHAVVLIDSLDGVPPHHGRKALGAARKIVDGGSLTVIAIAGAPLGGETTVVSLDPRLAAGGKFPAIDVARSWTIRPERLVGERDAEKIARARAKALGA